MIPSRQFRRMLSSHGVEFFTGVPDSLLGAFIRHLAASVPHGRHIVAANEGGAIALAAGHYMATGHPALVYMQNSGQGNAVNPLMSLAAPEVYGIPMLLLIGWRGEPGTPDAPQHARQGAITLRLLQALKLPHAVLPDEPDAAASCVSDMLGAAIEHRTPVALVVRKGTFGPDFSPETDGSDYRLSREAAVCTVVSCLDPDAVVVATTGKAARELSAYRKAHGGRPGASFLNIGAMGHASSIALAVALAEPCRRIVCLDGDGAALMHMGAMAIIGTRKPPNLTHIILNNGAHDSVGGLPTAGFDVCFPGIARACGYREAARVDDPEGLRSAMAHVRRVEGPVLLEVRVRKGARADLGRPGEHPRVHKRRFMEMLRV